MRKFLGLFSVLFLCVLAGCIDLMAPTGVGSVVPSELLLDSSGTTLSDKSRSAGTSFPTIGNDWFVVGRNDFSDAPYAGKIPVTITVSVAHQQYLPYIIFEVYRTYSYSGGYRGAKSGIGTVGGGNAANNRYPLHRILMILRK